MSGDKTCGPKPFRPIQPEETQPGYRILISNGLGAVGPGGGRHHSGNGLIGQQASCPNCGTPLFPAFVLDGSDPRIFGLKLWHAGVLEVPVCLACTFYLDPYWVDLCGPLHISGGYRSDDAPIYNLAQPYPVRQIELIELSTEDYPLSEGAIAQMVRRLRSPGVYHQIGGSPPFGRDEGLTCNGCGKGMLFAGVVDNDDAETYAFDEKGLPITLAIGDMRSLYFFTCPPCRIVGVKCFWP